MSQNDRRSVSHDCGLENLTRVRRLGGERADRDCVQADWPMRGVEQDNHKHLAVGLLEYGPQRSRDVR